MKSVNQRIFKNEHTFPLSGTPEYVNSGWIYALDESGRKYHVGQIDYEQYDEQNFQYVFILNWSIIDALPLLVFQGIPGLDMSLRLHKYYRVNMTPYFITERTPAVNREDIQDLLEEVNLDYYDRFEWMLRAKRECGIDNIIVERVCESKQYDLCLGEDVPDELCPSDIVKIKDYSVLGKTETQMRKNLLKLLSSGASVWDESEQRVISAEECSSMLKLLILQEQMKKDETMNKQYEGIKVAKREGKYKGRKRIDVDWILLEEISKELSEKRISESQAIQRSGLVSKSTFYRRLKELNHLKEEEK